MVSIVLLLYYYCGLYWTTCTVSWCWCHPIHTTITVQPKSMHITTFQQCNSCGPLHGKNKFQTNYIPKWKITHPQKTERTKNTTRGRFYVLLFSHICFVTFYSIDLRQALLFDRYSPHNGSYCQDILWIYDVKRGLCTRYI